MKDVVAAMRSGRPLDSNSGESSSPLQKVFGLSQNYSNPFNPSTTICYALPKDGEVSLSIYDLNGRLMKTLVSGAVAAGYHKVVWDGTDARGARVSSGVYVYRLKGQDFVSTKKLILAK